MTKFIIKRLLQAVPILIGIMTITFFIVHIAPGDPRDMIINQNSIRYQEFDAQTAEMLTKKFGLDQPIHVQYWRWLKSVSQGDLGISLRYRRPVIDLIMERLPFTVELALLALLFNAFFGMLFGIISAVKKYSLIDKSITIGSLVLHGVPGFWLALMLVLLLSVNLGILPVSQTRSLDYELLSPFQQFLDRAWHLILPVFVLGIGSAARTARYMRNKLLEVMDQEYIMAARARGLSERTIVYKHALRNAVIPIITIFGMALPMLFGGSVLIENVFSWPGLGTLVVEAVGNRDYPIIFATTLITSALVILGNLVADILYGLVDPRVSYANK